MMQSNDFFGKEMVEIPHLSVPDYQHTKLQEGGAEYIAEFINPREEALLINAINQETWITDLRRRVQHYGFKYDYAKRNLTESDKIGDLPRWAIPICENLVVQNIFPTAPEQMIVNEYEPGQGIAPHTDRDCFGDVVASLSLESDCIMDIYPDPQYKKNTFPILLERCSLLVLRGISREKWLHGIRPNKADLQSGCKYPRTRRLSLTFRTVVSSRISDQES